MFVRRVIGAVATLGRRTYAAGAADGMPPPAMAEKINLGDFNTLVAELRAVSQHPLHVPASKKKAAKEMPDTQFLKAIGRNDLIQAIRKKHGGFVAVAERLGWRIDTTNARESHIKLATREKRRAKRLQEVKKHRVF